MIKKRSYTLQYYLVLIVAYTLVTIMVPLGRNTRQIYNLSLTQAHVISLITLLPLFVVWFAAFSCYAKLQNYAWSVRKSAEGPSFKRIANGVAVLSWGLVVQAFASLIVNAISNHYPVFRSTGIIIQNYVTLLFPLIALPWIALGTRRLLDTSKSQVSPWHQHLLLVVFAVLGSFYSYLILHLNSSPDIMRLPRLIQLATIAVPYLYAWYAGLLAAFQMNTHAQRTGGIFYQRGLSLLSSGLTLFIVASILMQYLNSAFLSNLGTFSITTVLLIDHALLLAIALGYVVMIGGIRRLQRMEEI